jgi:TetR/AcrR family transcriptional regulator, transcriptional repressor of bet genes
MTNPATDQWWTFPEVDSRAAEIRGRLAAGLALAQEQGEVRAELDVDTAAAALAAFADGLAVQRAFEPTVFTRQLVRQLLDDYLGGFFT